MAQPVQCVEMQHINIVARDLDATVEHFKKVLGAQFVLDLPSDQWRAGLLHVAGVFLEVFAPREFLLNARYGSHYVGVEYEVADLADTRRRLTGLGLGLVRDIGVAIHTEPSECFGVAFEFYGGSFHRGSAVDWLEPLKPAQHWLGEHPLGLTGLSHYSVAVADHDAALSFYCRALDAAIIDDGRRPSVAARVTRLQLADTCVDLMSPLGAGPIYEQVYRYGDGMRSVTFHVADLDRAAVELSRWGCPVSRGDDDDTVAIAPEWNRGVMMELARYPGSSSEGQYGH